MQRYGTCRKDFGSKSNCRIRAFPIAEQISVHVLKILIIDDNADRRVLLEIQMGKGNRVVSSSYSDAINTIRDNPQFDLVIADWSRNMEHHSVLRELHSRQNDYDFVFIAMTGHLDEDVLSDKMCSHAIALQRDFSINFISALIERVKEQLAEPEKKV